MADEIKDDDLKTQKTGFLTDSHGVLSVRRLLALMLAIASIGLAIANVIMETDWKMALITIGIPMVGSLLFMFFTSWESVAKVVEATKRK